MAVLLKLISELTAPFTMGMPSYIAKKGSPFAAALQMA